MSGNLAALEDAEKKEVNSLFHPWEKYFQLVEIGEMKRAVDDDIEESLVLNRVVNTISVRKLSNYQKPVIMAAADGARSLEQLLTLQ